MNKHFALPENKTMTFSTSSKAARRYQAVGVASGIMDASPHRLVQMLMEGALDKIAVAKGCIERSELEAKGQHINWALSIVTGLRESLDLQAGGAIAENLDGLYDYSIRRLLQANLHNDPGILDEVAGLLNEIKSAWDALPEDVKYPSRAFNESVD